MLRVFLFIAVISSANAAFSQTEWELTKEKNGIKVFASKESSSNFRSIKVEAVLTGTLQKLLTVITDVNNAKNWVFSTKESYLIKKINPNEILYYTETSLPWPVSNRDVPIRMRIDADGATNSLKITAAGEPNAVAAKKGIVRIQTFASSWNVRSDGKNRLYITYFLKMDPGGSIPASITNMFISKGPYETFYNLSNMLKL